MKALLARDEELDGLFERIYEDNVSGKISDERFSRMSRRYEDEQKELTEKIKVPIFIRRKGAEVFHPALAAGGSLMAYKLSLIHIFPVSPFVQYLKLL